MSDAVKIEKVGDDNYRMHVINDYNLFSDLQKAILKHDHLERAVIMSTMIMLLSGVAEYSKDCTEFITETYKTYCDEISSKMRETNNGLHEH